ncbi:PD-(D/E)XK nuclease-like domain-containing protein [Pontibacter sp. JAM-7]|uniref:PD-(D/E)XK nuclease-like domain-containing protein n=1 Tax=Pontibacter sp. JAM-7 TaxID=3366581 RepID=UPI003AF8BDCF
MNAPANPFDIQQDKTGVFPGIPNADYHAGEGLSSSALKLLLKSPLHYKHQYIDGNRTESTAAMLMGSLVHTMVLEPDELEHDYLIIDASTRTTKAYKEAAEFAGNRTPVLLTELDSAAEIANAVLAHPTAANLLRGSQNEHSVYWMERDGLLCKCRPDIWRPDIGVVADLKTTTDASPGDFAKQIANLGYHISAEWYLRGIEKATGTRPDTWAWVVVEKSAPFAVQIYEADSDMLAKAADKIDAALDLLAECQRTGHWPAYQDGIQKIYLPAWAA